MLSSKTIISDEDKSILEIIRSILNCKPTYGYRRMTAVINAKYSHMIRSRINHKRIYRIMKENNLLLPRFAGKPLRVHDGKIITLHSNTRWCSDSFYISCDNGERVHVAFSLDTCDREAMRYIATTGGINGEMIRDLMVETMHHRFGQIDKLPKCIQWLTDNGPCYVSTETVKFGRILGFDICTTRPYSPESNGMAEAFVKTFKRDYVWLGDLSSAKVVMDQLPHWFNEYNEHAPHKGLKMVSPREYIRMKLNG